MSWWTPTAGKCPVSHRFELHKPAITPRHLTRLRQIYCRSGWSCRDMVEVVLQEAGPIEARIDGHETLALTPVGLELRFIFGALKSEDAKGSFF